MERRTLHTEFKVVRIEGPGLNPRSTFRIASLPKILAAVLHYSLNLVTVLNIECEMAHCLKFLNCGSRAHWEPNDSFMGIT